MKQNIYSLIKNYNAKMKSSKDLKSKLNPLKGIVLFGSLCFSFGGLSFISIIDFIFVVQKWSIQRIPLVLNIVLWLVFASISVLCGKFFDYYINEFKDVK